MAIGIPHVQIHRVMPPPLPLQHPSPPRPCIVLAFPTFGFVRVERPSSVHRRAFAPHRTPPSSPPHPRPRPSSVSSLPSSRHRHAFSCTCYTPPERGSAAPGRSPYNYKQKMTCIGAIESKPAKLKAKATPKQQFNPLKKKKKKVHQENCFHGANTNNESGAKKIQLDPWRQ